jgi:hypothetical protein
MTFELNSYHWIAAVVQGDLLGSKNALSLISAFS